MQRKAFRRSLSLRLRPGEPLLVSAARLTGRRTICEFIDAKVPWIEKHLRRFDEIEKHHPRQLVRGGSYSFLGKNRVLTAVPTPQDKPFFSLNESSLQAHLPTAEYRALKTEMDFEYLKPALRELYRREAERLLTRKIAHWGPHVGRKPSSLEFKETRSRWGSCHPDGRIRLNWRLIAHSEDLIDYVVVHELAHLIHMDHSPNFWNLVKSLLPDAKARALELRRQSCLSDFLDLK